MTTILIGLGCFVAGLCVQAWRDTADHDRSHQEARFWQAAWQYEIDQHKATAGRTRHLERHIRALTGPYVRTLAVDGRRAGLER